MAFGGNVNYNVSLDFFLHFTSKSLLLNGGKIISKI